MTVIKRRYDRKQTKKFEKARSKMETETERKWKK